MVPDSCQSRGESTEEDRAHAAATGQLAHRVVKSGESGSIGETKMRCTGVGVS